MDPILAAILGGAVGLVIVGLAIVATRLSERSLEAPPDDAGESEIPRGVEDVLSILPSISIVLDASDRVVNTSGSAVRYGLVRHGEVAHDELLRLARATRRDGEIRELDLTLTRGTSGIPTMMRARVGPLGERHVLILADDQTQAHRVEEVRRDFVANVSHELKTPVGGISLLAEAILDARDDPEAVERFTKRILLESRRLSDLVGEIVDLSRLQVADAMQDPHRVSLNAVIADVSDRIRVAAEAKGIEVSVHAGDDLWVYGDMELLTKAIMNLVSNAVIYSDERTRVGIGATRRGDEVDVVVTDQGPGIPQADQERIFERFYRVDLARSRESGGTGLGLAIVKHVAGNHGGSVSVWSLPGHGSTFTLTLPLADPDTPDQGAETPDSHENRTTIERSR